MQYFSKPHNFPNRKDEKAMRKWLIEKYPEFKEIIEKSTFKQLQQTIKAFK